MNKNQNTTYTAATKTTYGDGSYGGEGTSARLISLEGMLGEHHEWSHEGENDSVIDEILERVTADRIIREGLGKNELIWFFEEDEITDAETGERRPKTAAEKRKDHFITHILRNHGVWTRRFYTPSGDEGELAVLEVGPSAGEVGPGYYAAEALKSGGFRALENMARPDTPVTVTVTGLDPAALLEALNLMQRTYGGTWETEEETETD